MVIKMSLILLSLFCVTWVASCPVDDPCYCGSIIHCNFMDLTKVPTITPSNTAYPWMDLSQNQIASIPESAFNGVVTAALDLTDNPITNIEEGGFKGLETSLKRLIFVRTSLATLPKSMGDFKNLIQLDVGYNQITSIPDEVFQGLGTILEILNLQSTQLSQWPSGLQYMQKLQHLDISYNHFGQVPANAFSGLVSTLKYLNLESCSLTSFPDAINSLKVLEELNLAGNPLVTIPDAAFGPNLIASLHILNISNTQLTTSPSGVKKLTTLSKLSMGNNNIVSVEDDLFSGMNNTLQELYINNCNMTKVPIVAFLGLGAVQHLDMSHNKLLNIQNFDFSELSSLENLVLDNNPIVSIKFRAFDRCNLLTKISCIRCSMQTVPGAALGSAPNLTFADFSHNTITRLDEGIFPQMDKLRIVKLTGNFIGTIARQSLEPLNAMEILYLDECGLVEVPKAIQAAPHLQEINLHGNSITCDCSLNWINSWKIANGLIPRIFGECIGSERSLDDYTRYFVQDCP